MGKTISNHIYDIYKYCAIAALIAGILILCFAPRNSATNAYAKNADGTEVTYEAIALSVKVVDSAANKQAKEVEAPTETASVISQAEPEATEETETEVPTQPVKEPDYHNRYAGIVPSISDSDRDILVRLVYHESRGIGGEAVMETVLNRMLDDEFPDTVEGVVYQKNQFEPAKGLYTYPIKEPDSYALCEEVVEKVLSADYEPILPSYYLYFNNFGADSNDYEWHGGNVFYGYPA